MAEAGRSLDELVAADAAARTLGIAVRDARPGHVELTMTVVASMLNFGGTCHGGVLFHLADTAMSYVSNQDGSPAVATAANIDFVSAAHEGEQLQAVISTTVEGRSAVHDGIISVDERVVALFRGKTLQLSPKPPSND